MYQCRDYVQGANGDLGTGCERLPVTKGTETTQRTHSFGVKIYSYALTFKKKYYFIYNNIILIVDAC